MKAHILLCVLIAAVPTAAKTRTHDHSDISHSIRRSAAYHSTIRAAAVRHAVDPRLLWTIAYLESRFQPHAVSRKGARGLMQFIPATGRRYGLLSLRDLHDPLRSIDAAAQYLRDLNQMFGGRIDLVLAGYNAGENAVIRSGYRVPPYRETRKYVARGVLVLRRIAEANIFWSTLPEWKPQISQTKPTLATRQVMVPRQEAHTRSRPSRSIYFKLP
jgi:soluble lytic murein transglycosylase-like protein